MPRDLYRTIDPRAVRALLPHLGEHVAFIEPCAGHGDLVDQIVAAGHECIIASDIQPMRADIVKANAARLRMRKGMGGFQFITNPPFRRALLEPIMARLLPVAPTWLLLPADYAHNLWFARWMAQCTDVVSIGRLYWFAEEGRRPIQGVDNHAWFRFDAHDVGGTLFWPRRAAK